jgi:acetolactate synthase-1/2/3 large subunit
MPLLDAVTRAGRIRFVPARGEAGAMNMADAFSRVSGGIGVCLTSTGTAAGNAAGAQAEALVAGSRVLHITSQVDAALADRDRAAIHDVPRQPDMLRAVSKAVFRAWEPGQAGGALVAAVAACRAAPSGPVSLELPVDVQRAPQPVPSRTFGAETPRLRATDTAIAALAERLQAARRPILWLGGGARPAQNAVMALAARGIGVVTSTQGRATLPEDHPGSLGAFNMTPEAADLYRTCDLMIVAGSRLRGNETRNNKLPLPPIAQIDADASQIGRNYPVEMGLHADAADTLERLAAALPEGWSADPALAHDIAVARARSEGRLRDTLGPYQVIADALATRVLSGAHPWVRDVTISNSTFGNRYVPIAAPHLGVHALGGGIGQGIAMGIGAAIAAQHGGMPRPIVLCGDGGAQLGLAEIATIVEERAPMALILMNDRAYGVIGNIQDAQYEGRRDHSALLTPDFADICQSVGLAHTRVSAVEEFAQALDAAVSQDGPVMIEVDMTAIGDFAQPFAGPPAGAAQKA